MKPLYPQVIGGMASTGPTAATTVGHMQDILHPAQTEDFQIGSQRASPQGIREN